MSQECAEEFRDPLKKPKQPRCMACNAVLPHGRYFYCPSADYAQCAARCQDRANKEKEKQSG